MLKIFRAIFVSSSFNGSSYFVITTDLGRIERRKINNTIIIIIERRISSKADQNTLSFNAYGLLKCRGEARTYSVGCGGLSQIKSPKKTYLFQERIMYRNIDAPYVSLTLLSLCQVPTGEVLIRLTSLLALLSTFPKALEIAVSLSCLHASIPPRFPS